MLEMSSAAMRMLARGGPNQRLSPRATDVEERDNGSNPTVELIGSITEQQATVEGEERAEVFVDRAAQYFNSVYVSAFRTFSELMIMTLFRVDR